MTEEKRFGERVMEAVSAKDNNKVVPITFPKTVYNRFKKYSFDEASGCYWLAIEKLMDKNDLSKELNVLVEQTGFLTEQVIRLDSELQTLKGAKAVENNTFKTFGRKE